MAQISRKTLAFRLLLAMITLQGCEYNSIHLDQRIELSSSISDAEIKKIEDRIEDESCEPRNKLEQTLANGATRAYATRDSKYHYQFASTINFKFTNELLETKGSYTRNSSKEIKDSDAAPYLNPIYARREIIYAGGNQKTEFERLGLTSLRCSVILIAQVKRYNGDLLATVVDFDPPLPYLMAPGENGTLQAKEIPEDLESTEITANFFTPGTNGELKLVKSFKTKAKIKRTGTTSEDESVLSSQRFQFQTIFDSPRQTMDLGLFPTSEWEISENKISSYSFSTSNIITDPKLAVSQSSIIYK